MKITLSYSEAGKYAGTGKDNISRLVLEGNLGFVTFDKLKNNKRIPIQEIERYIKANTFFSQTIKEANDERTNFKTNNPKELQRA